MNRISSISRIKMASRVIGVFVTGNFYICNYIDNQGYSYIQRLRCADSVLWPRRQLQANGFEILIVH